MNKRKNPQKNSFSKQRREKAKKASSKTFLRNFLFGSVLLIIIIILMALAGWVGFEAGKEKALKEYEKSAKNYESDIKRLRDRLNELKDKDSTILKDDFKPNDYTNLETNLKDIQKAKPLTKRKKAKLVIIIDDVAFSYQVKKIKTLPWKITPSFFPPSSDFPNTPTLAKTVDSYIIHLPMEASSYKSDQKFTLTIDSTKEDIDNRLKNLRKWFPDAKFINNHTGSRFTSDILSMENFYKLAKKYGFLFVDSRTTPNTVVPELSKKYGKLYLGRDIFLDNELDVKYIKKQLQKAVKIAMSRGYAIAIGHPHSETFQALLESKELLKDVDIVYLEELYLTVKNGG